MRTCLHWRRAASWLAVFAMVFTQAAIAAHACAGMQAAANAPSQEMPCHPDGDPTPLPPCAAHCDDGAQNVDAWPGSAAACPFAPSFIATLAAPDSSAAPGAAPMPGLLHATSPPLTIRNCCFRI